MARLDLTVDPTGAVTATTSVKKGLDGVKIAATGAEKGLDRLGKQGAKDMSRLSRETNKVASSTKRAGQSVSDSTNQMDRFTRSTSGAAGQTGNLAAQFNDIGVTLAMGQSPLTIALQQGTQISQVLNTMGGGTSALRSLGAAFMSMINPISLATIGIIGFGAAAVQWFMRATEGAKPLSESLEDVEDAISSYVSAVEEMSVSNQELENRFGSASEAVRELIADIAESQGIIAQAGIDQLTQSLSELYAVRGDGARGAGIADFFDVNIFFAAGKEARKLREEARELTGEFLAAQNALKNSAGDLDRQFDATQRLKSAAEELADLSGDRSVEEAEVVKQIAEALLRMGELKGASEAAINPIAEQAAQAERLSRALQAATDAQSFLLSRRFADEASLFSLPVEAGPLPDNPFAEAEQRQFEQESASFSRRFRNEEKLFDLPVTASRVPKNPFEEDKKRKRGGGGKSETEKQADAFKSLVESLDPAIAAQNQFNEAKKVINQQLKAGNIDQEESNRLMGLASERFDEAKQSIQDLADQDDGIKRLNKSMQELYDQSNFVEGAGEEFQSSLSDFFFDPFDEGLEGMVFGFNDALRRMAADAVSARLTEAVFGMFTGGSGGGTGEAASGIAGFFAGLFRDRGGYLPSGRTAIVAERRPEEVNGQLISTPTAIRGPANIMSGAATAQQGMGGAMINQKNVIALNPADIAAAATSDPSFKTQVIQIGYEEGWGT